MPRADIFQARGESPYSLQSPTLAFRWKNCRARAYEQIDSLAHELGHGYPPFRGQLAKAPGLLLCQLNLSSNHKPP